MVVIRCRIMMFLFIVQDTRNCGHGLNILCHATSATPSTLLPLSPPSTSTHPGSSDIIQTYLDTSNSDFFAPRGLRVSIRSLNALLTSLAIPTDRGQRAAAAATALDPNASDSQRCDALHPWAERLGLDVPAPSAHITALREMGTRLRATSSAPASIQRMDCSTVARVSIVSVVVMVWTLMGCPLPNNRSPTLTSSVLRRPYCVRE